MAMAFFLRIHKNRVPMVWQTFVVLTPPEEHVGIEEVAHRELLHVFAHLFNRFAEVLRDPDLSRHVSALAFGCRGLRRCRAQFRNGFTALGNDEALARACLPEQLGKFGLCSKSPNRFRFIGRKMPRHKD